MTPEEIAALVKTLKEQGVAAKVTIQPDGTVTIETKPLLVIPDMSTRHERTVAASLPNLYILRPSPQYEPIEFSATSAPSYVGVTSTSGW